MNLSPVLLFVYNRPEHTRKTVEALRNNTFASESELIIYSDAPKNDDAENAVKQVRDYIKTISGFKKVTIIERDKNWGLADSIIHGVTETVNQHGRVIVIEDDIVTSPYFLKFMNNALEFYYNEPRVWHISGWNYPIDTNNLGDLFFMRLMNCWGWATWSDRWKHFQKDPQKLVKIFDAAKIREFDLGNSGIFWSQVTGNVEKKINTWAIFWYATIFLNNGLCLNPSRSFVSNVGLDGSGIHCGKDEKMEISRVNNNSDLVFPEDICESEIAVKRIKRFYRMKRRNILIRICRKLSSIMRRHVVK